MDASASSRQILIPLHQVNEELDDVGHEINVAIEGQQLGILSDDGLAINRNGQFHELIAQQVVHEHDLTSSLPVMKEEILGFKSTENQRTLRLQSTHEMMKSTRKCLPHKNRNWIGF